MAKLRKEYNPNKASRRKRRPIIYIICEGKETETLYFKHFRSRNCLVDIVPISATKWILLAFLYLFSDFLNFVGVVPVISLNTRIKCEESLKPQLWAMNETG